MTDSVDELQAQFVRAWHDGCRPRIENYLHGVAEESRRPLLRALITTEAFLRRESGEQPSPEEYQQRFPADRSLVESLFSESTGMTGGDTLGPDCTPAAPSENVTCHAPMAVGRYRIVRLLGQGAFGAVYEAHDSELERSVAVKIPRLSGFDTNAAAEEWLAEARTLARLDHPGIIPVYDVGRTAEGMCYLVEKYVPGGNLSQYAAATELTLEQAARLVALTAEALHHAHVRGLVHRDVKPANILIDEGGQPLLADFGLALPDAGEWHRRGEISGTPPYMSPEQIRGEVHRLDGRSDIWSLGVILYELLAGRRPFLGESFQQLFDEIEHRAPKPLRMMKQGIPPELERITLRCLSKDVASRYHTAQDMADDLRRWLPPLQPSDETVRPVAGSSPRRWGAIAALVAALLLLAAGLLVPRLERLRTMTGLGTATEGDPASRIALRPGETERTAGERGVATPVSASPLIFATRVATDGRAIDPGSSFPPDIQDLYAVFRSDAPPPGMQVDAAVTVDGAYYAYLRAMPHSAVSSLGWRWYRGGELVNEYTTPVSPGETVWLQRFDYNAGGIFGDELTPGEFTVVVTLGGNPAMSADLTIAPVETQ